MEINIELNSDVIDLLNAFPERVAIATRRSINRAIDGINTDSARIIREKYNIKKRSINIGIKKLKATGKSLNGKVEIGGRPISLKEFNPRPNRIGIRRPKEGITISIRRGERTLYKGSFLDRRGNIFVRKGKERLPIKKLYGPRLYQMIDDNSRVGIRDMAKERLLKAFTHEMEKGGAYK